MGGLSVLFLVTAIAAVTTGHHQGLAVFCFMAAFVLALMAVVAMRFRRG
jgi:hypothetical protein